jgi:hypothetical protein
MEYLSFDSLDETNIFKGNFVFNIIILLLVILTVIFSVLRYLYRNDNNLSNRKLTALYGFYISNLLLILAILYSSIKRYKRT